MPKILREASEPPKIYMRDYSLDVKAHTKAVLEKV